MKNKELQNMTTNELTEKLKEISLELMKNRGQVAAGGSPKSTGMIRKNRRVIARIRNVLNNRTEEAKK